MAHKVCIWLGLLSCIAYAQEEFTKPKQRVLKESRSKIQEDMLNSAANSMQSMIQHDKAFAEGQRDMALAKEAIFDISLKILNQEYAKNEPYEKTVARRDQFQEIEKQAKQIAEWEKQLAQSKTKFEKAVLEVQKQ